MGKSHLRGACENPVVLSMYDGPIETVKHIWVNIFCILDRILLHGLLWVNPGA